MKRFSFTFWEAVGIIGGMIIGSGMFALPYGVSVSGLWWSVAAAAAAFFAVLSIHLAYGEVVAHTKEEHRLPGYAALYLGRWAGYFGKITQLLGFNTGLLVYGILGGIFLSTIFGGSATAWSIIFFVVGSGVVLFADIKKIGTINFLLSIPLVAAIVWISFLGFGKGDVAQISFASSDPFFVFGIFVFSLTGLSVIADARDVFKSESKTGPLKRAIMVGTTIPLFVYILFIVSVLMVSGTGVTEDALSGMAAVLGRGVIIIGAVIGILATFTSYIALGYDLKEIYALDLNMGRFWSGLLSVAVPIFLFLFVAEDFVKLISIMGGMFVAFDGLLVIGMLRALRAKIPAPHAMRFLPFNAPHQAVLVVIFVLSIVYEVVYQIL